jgi:mycothiol synthase
VCYVHPGHFEKGIGTCLVRRSETRAREELPLAPHTPIAIHNHINAENPEARELLTREGYAPVRYFWRMEGTFAEAPVPAWPSGVTVRPCRPGQDERILHAVIDEAMTGHWGHEPLSFDDWMRRRQQRGFVPDLSFLAFAGAEPAGGAVCRYSEGIGWIDLLGVREPWRNRGLGRALLFHVFAAFLQRGTARVGLGVDAANPTGATRLYEEAGMTVTQQYATYGKELRSGAEGFQ